MKKFIISMAGAATVLASAVAFIDYANRRSKNNDRFVGELVFGIVGSLAGVALAVLSEKLEQPKELVLEDMISDDDVALMHENISEVLGASAEHADTKKALRTVAGKRLPAAAPQSVPRLQPKIGKSPSPIQ